MFRLVHQHAASLHKSRFGSVILELDLVFSEFLPPVPFEIRARVVLCGLQFVLVLKLSQKDPVASMAFALHLVLDQLALTILVTIHVLLTTS